MQQFRKIKNNRGCRDFTSNYYLNKGTTSFLFVNGVVFEAFQKHSTLFCLQTKSF